MTLQAEMMPLDHAARAFYSLKNNIIAHFFSLKCKQYQCQLSFKEQHCNA
jgi:hypothetical protein